MSIPPHDSLMHRFALLLVLLSISLIFTQQGLADPIENMKREATFLRDNKEKEGVQVTPSGLQYEVIKKGEGPKPRGFDRVRVHYRGQLLNGKVFDSSFSRGQPAVFGVQQVIPGWTEALQLMPVGSEWRLYIPSKLAYGAQGSPPVIGPNELLIFDVSLIAIVP
ncbi:MAG: FKBP-type peptidyl-prolyl cis-trans isomerase [Candidatus Methylacidiphilales bacterium]